LRKQGIPELPFYEKALAAACDACPPPFGRKEYGELYKRSSIDPDWVALSLLTAAQSEGEGARHLWDMAACTADFEIARQMQQHAIDEARHSRGYVTLLGLIFPDSADEQLQARLANLSPGYTLRTPLIASAGSPFAYSATVDELIQMNIAEIRTRIYHVLQRPVLLSDYCHASERSRVRQILDWLLVDETQHIAYTARLIERAARGAGASQVMDLMLERIKDFNEITEEEIAQRTLAAA
jgi:hypothetical protein